MKRKPTKHKIGTTVRVKNDLKAGERYDGGVLVTDEMTEKTGKRVTIKSYVPCGKNTYYKIKNDSRNYTWSDSMFENPLKDIIKKVKQNEKTRKGVI